MADLRISFLTNKNVVSSLGLQMAILGVHLDKAFKKNTFVVPW